MKAKAILAGVSACIGITAWAQDAGTAEPKGKAIVRVFTDFHTGFGAGRDDRGFNLERSYFGYEYDFGKGLSARAVMDIGKSDDVSDYQRIAYVKNAMVAWKMGGLTLNGGLVPTTMFDFQEKFWGYRYLMKSFQDEHKFGSSADLGVSAAYRFAPWVSADAIIVNGEGYKKVQKKDGLNYGLGVTLSPAKGFYIRMYGGWNRSDEDGRRDVGNVAAFAGYKRGKFMLGAEYNRMWNTSSEKGHDLNGCSVYASVECSREVGLLARFDGLYSKDDWNLRKDGSTAVLGAQFSPGKHVRIAPNVRMNVPRSDGARPVCSAYVNCFFGL